MSSLRPRASLLTVIAFLLCSCTVVPPREPPSAPAGELWQQRAPRLQALSDWSFNGRAAVDGPELPSRTVRINWSAAGAAYRLSFMSPLGQQVAELAGDAVVASLRVPGEETRSAASPEALLHDALGWSAPLRGLRYWVRGLPAPAAEPLTGDDAGSDVQGDIRLDLDDWGRLTALAQDGWDVRIDRYTEVGNLELPRRLTLSREGLRIRLLIDEWRLES